MTELEKLREINVKLDETYKKLVYQNDRLEHQINMMTLQEINNNLKNLGGNK